jgi:hypothetical protein
MPYALRRTNNPFRRRALELLTDAGPIGVTEAVMLANDVKVETLVTLVKQGLAIATPQRLRAGPRDDRGRHAADYRRGAPRMRFASAARSLGANDGFCRFHRDGIPS